MAWSMTYLVIQIIARILGANAAASILAAKEYRLGGIISHSIAGAIGGGLSGAFLQTLAITMVTANGSVNEPRFADQLVVQSLAGAVAGGVTVLLCGFIKHSIDHR